MTTSRTLPHGSTRPRSGPRRRRAIGALLVAGVLVITACGGDDDATATTVAVSTAAPAPVSSETATTIAATSDTADLADLPAPSDTGDIPLPVGTGDIPLPVGTGDIPLPPVTADLPYQISVTVGLDSGDDRIEMVPLGATVVLTVVNPDEADEFHLHGFDLGDDQVMPAGQPASFTFVANQVGSFELESHETGGVLMILEIV
ncbi:MAG: hypothetical protein KDB40_07670 [Acidimicrobiales bacterium]|nr:hypothetical protein [Acidimicrobiales bacterium]MCB9393086.1 hypothetical protein [Acidimicrobiaceae bacterium]